MMDTTLSTFGLILLLGAGPALTGCDGMLGGGGGNSRETLDLHSCGNQVCNPRESCSSCPEDCGECPADGGLAPRFADGALLPDAGSWTDPDSGPTPAPDVGAVALDSGAAAPLALRPSARGTMTRAFNSGITTKFPFIDHQVVDALWSQLEASGSGTSPGGYYAPGTQGWASIEKALKSGAKIRLRLRAGRHAPAYIKRIGFNGVYDPLCPDGGIYIFNAWDSVGGCSPKFWLPAVLWRYEALMKEVRNRLGAYPNLLEVVASACMTTYAEPFYRAHQDKASNQRLLAAGLTWRKDLYCHQQAILIHARTFKQIRTSVAVNPWDIMNPNDTVDYVDHRWAETYALLEGGGPAAWQVLPDGSDSTTPWPGARQVLKSRLTLQNNGLGEDEGCTLAGGDSAENAKKKHYCYLSYIARTTGHNVGFQTETMDRLRGKMCKTCSASCQDCTYLRSEAQGVQMVADRALSMHAAFIELPSGFAGWTSPADIGMLDAKDAALEANAP